MSLFGYMYEPSEVGVMMTGEPLPWSGRRAAMLLGKAAFEHAKGAGAEYLSRFEIEPMKAEDMARDVSRDATLRLRDDERAYRVVHWQGREWWAGSSCAMIVRRVGGRWLVRDLVGCIVS
jgi:hypothetical protein